MVGDPQERYVLGTNAGFGFVTKLEGPFGKNRAGKVVISIPSGRPYYRRRLCRKATLTSAHLSLWSSQVRAGY